VPLTQDPPAIRSPQILFWPSIDQDCAPAGREGPASGEGGDVAKHNALAAGDSSRHSSTTLAISFEQLCARRGANVRACS